VTKRGCRRFGAASVKVQWSDPNASAYPPRSSYASTACCKRSSTARNSANACCSSAAVAADSPWPSGAAVGGAAIGGAAGRADSGGGAVAAAELARLMPDEAEVAGLLAAAVHRVASPVAVRTGRFASAPGRPGPCAAGSLVDCRGLPACGGVSAARSAGPISAAGGEQRCACGSGQCRSHRLGTDRHVVRPVAQGRTYAPVVALNRAVAVAELRGPRAALKLVEDLQLDNYYAFHATRADLLRRLGRDDEARAAYERAADLALTEAERAVLRRGGRGSAI
jgi:hypothetical protein